MKRIKLQLIDHQRVIVEGAKSLNESLRLNSPDPLKRYLASLKITPEESIVKFREERINTLRDIAAPSHMLEFEIEALATITGEAYSVKNTAEMEIDELRALLVNLFIPWSSFELYIQGQYFAKIGQQFPNKSNVPQDSAGVSLVTNREQAQSEYSGYHAPNDVNIIPMEFIEKLDEKDVEHREELLSNFVSRCRNKGYGMFYQLVK